jgi:DNA-binding MarR family transcriptional regulator
MRLLPREIGAFILMGHSGLSITLTKAQAAQLLQQASAQQKTEEMVAAFDPAGRLLESARRLMDDERYSRVLARAMMVFASFPDNGQPCSVTELADQLSMSPSMVHRYIATFVELGLLERDPVSRRYKRRRTK